MLQSVQLVTICSDSCGFIIFLAALHLKLAHRKNRALPTHTLRQTHTQMCFVMGSTSYKLICMSMKWHFNATLYFHYCCCFVAIVGAIGELEVRGKGRKGGDAGSARYGVRNANWELKLVSSNELRFVATCKTHLFWHEAHKSIFDPFRSSLFSFVFGIHTDGAKEKGVKSFPWLLNHHHHPLCFGLFW